MYVAKPGGELPPLIPNLREEIDRKAHETLEWLIMSAVHDKITPEQFDTGLDTLFMAVNGLAGKDFLKMVEAATAVLRATREDYEEKVKPMPKPEKPAVKADSEHGEDYGVW